MSAARAATPRGADRHDADLMTWRERPGELPLEGLLGRRSLAIAPWIAAGPTSAAFGLSTLLRGWPHDVNWVLVLLTLVVASVSAVLYLTIDLPLAIRYRRTAWVYAVLGAAVLASISIIAAADIGPASVVYIGICPVATYGGLVAPRRARVPTIVLLAGVTLLLQLTAPGTSWFDFVIVETLTVAAWSVGVLMAMTYARVSEIAWRSSQYDRPTGALNRRGFMLQLQRAARQGGGAREPLALLLVTFADPTVDLRAVAEAIGSHLPAAAELGRLSDREFGALLVGHDRAVIQARAEAIRGAFVPRAGVRVGTATSETRAVSARDLFRTAEAALGMATPEQVRSLVAGSVHRAEPSKAESAETRSLVSYAHLRQTGRMPRIDDERRVTGLNVALALVAVGLAGVPVIIRSFIDGGPGIYDELLRVCGVPWVAVLLALAGATVRWWTRRASNLELLIIVTAGCLLAFGVAAASLARDGLLTPLCGAFFIMVLYAAAILSQTRAIGALVLMLIGWSTVAALGPASADWVIPFHLAMFPACFVLGTAANRAMTDTARSVRRRAFTDDLTGLRNAAGFDEEANEIYRTAATSTGTPFAVVGVRVDGLRAVNDALGYAAGDGLLRDLAEALTAALPDGAVAARTGARSFAAAFPIVGTAEASRAAQGVGGHLRGLTAIAVSHATWPADGASLEAVVAAAQPPTPAAAHPGDAPRVVGRAALVEPRPADAPLRSQPMTAGDAPPLAKPNSRSDPEAGADQQPGGNTR